jgi:hypothetical protein
VYRLSAGCPSGRLVLRLAVQSQRVDGINEGEEMPRFPLPSRLYQMNINRIDVQLNRRARAQLHLHKYAGQQNGAE